MAKYNIAVLGLGAIFSRHLSAIQNNPDKYNLVGIYDPKNELKDKYGQELNVVAYESEDALFADKTVNCIAILTPNNLHYDQAYRALSSKRDVIMEKPATFTKLELDQLCKHAHDNGVNIFGVLQVRLNPAVQIAKEIIDQNILGEIRGVSLVQRWQRPQNYFSGWRGMMETGGGILREFGIHYLDAMQFILSRIPNVSSATGFNTKFQETDVNDTVYSLFDFGTFGGSMEISISAEPKNIECTLIITGENGYIRLGGKSLDEIIDLELLNQDDLIKVEAISDKIKAQDIVGLALQGASPYHPEMYKQIVINPDKFRLTQMGNVIELVEKIYSKIK